MTHELKTKRVVVRVVPSKFNDFEEYVKSINSTKTEVVEAFIDRCILELKEISKNRN